MPENSAASAIDLYNSLLEFFNLFPEYKGRKFYFSGESYAGKYVPHAYYYTFLNRATFPATLMGVMLGNAMMKPVRVFLKITFIADYSIHFLQCAWLHFWLVGLSSTSRNEHAL